MYDYNNPPYGTPAYFEKMERLKNAHKSPDGILAMKQAMTTNTVPGGSIMPSALGKETGNGNPLPTTVIPPGTQVNPRQGGTPGQRFMDGAKGILGQLAGSQSGQQQSPVEVATQQATPTHTMPDGTVMPGATHEDTFSGPGMLARPQPERYVPAPVRESLGMEPMTDQERVAFAQTPAGQRLMQAQSMDPDLKQPNQTDKKRDKTSFGDYLKKKVYEDDPRGGNSLSSKLIRMGGAIQGSSHQGLNAAMAAMGGEYGNIQREDQASEQAFMQEQAKQQEAQQKKSAEFDEIIGTYDSSIAEMDRLYADVFAAGDTLTGPYDGFMGKWIDNLRGNPEAYTRLAMDQFKVDEILKNVAKTKGAISDKEMETFERPMPSMSADEDVWLDWIYKKREAAISVRKKLRAMQGGGSASNYSPEDQALVDQYSQ